MPHSFRSTLVIELNPPPEGEVVPIKRRLLVVQIFHAKPPEDPPLALYCGEPLYVGQTLEPGQHLEAGYPGFILVSPLSKKAPA